MLILQNHFKEKKTGLDAMMDEVEDLCKRNTDDFLLDVQVMVQSSRQGAYSYSSYSSYSVMPVFTVLRSSVFTVKILRALVSDSKHGCSGAECCSRLRAHLSGWSVTSAAGGYT